MLNLALNLLSLSLSRRRVIPMAIHLNEAQDHMAVHR